MARRGAGAAAGTPLTPRASLFLLGRPRSAFHVLGLTGLAVSLVVCAAVLAARGVPAWALPLIASTAVATFLSLALAMKALTGRETLVYYHHEILVLAACAAAASAAGLDVPASLDAAVLGIGAFLAFGRLGCLNAGCCHGRPARRGVRYGAEHVRTGFPEELAGVRLAPVQAYEAAIAAAITVAGLLLVAAGAAPGVPLVAYVAAYGIARFALEEWRGDEGRRRLLGFSEAQWTSLLLTAAAAIAHPVAAIAPAAIAVAMIALASRGRPGDPEQPGRLARALLRSDASAAPVRLDGGLLLSAGTVDGCRHYTLSGADTERLRAVARALLELRHPGAAAQVQQGDGGVLHVVVPVARQPAAELAGRGAA